MKGLVDNCPYCDSEVLLKDSSIVYGRSYGLIYICSNFPTCLAYVGTHRNTTEPLGTLANKELRELRNQCHILFDRLWKPENGKMKGKMSRTKSYEWLAEQLEINVDDCHIGYFREDMCRKVIKLLS